MEKEKADRIITEYFKKLYGFAVRKSYSYDEAEELCAEIVLQVYQTLLKAEDIVNTEGYIWRICEHTYAKYVSTKKQRAGVSIDEVVIPYYDEPEVDEDDTEIHRLRREITFMSATRRRIVFLFYYRKRSIASISAELAISEGTVKWHLNKARAELKEGISMERKIGMLGLHPIEATSMGHSGNPGKNGGPEYYLGDKINLNIVYSVYNTPRSKEEIAEEIGVSLVYIEDKIHFLEENGFLVQMKGGKYTTYVKFSPQKYSVELEEKQTRLQLMIAEKLAKEYVPQVRTALAEGNRELFEAAVVFHTIATKCGFDMDKDLSKYVIRTMDGGSFFANVNIHSEASDPEYIPVYRNLPCYNCCGGMYRVSEKYPVSSWSVDSRFSTRVGTWKNNLLTDYEYMYEYLRGELPENAANAEKLSRLRERKYISDDGKVNIMVVKGRMEDVFEKVPELDPAIRDTFGKEVVEYAMMTAKEYPPQMQDFIVTSTVNSFIGNVVAMMVMDILYANATFKLLTETEKTTTNLLMFCDILP